MSDARLLLCCFAVALLAFLAIDRLDRSDPLACYPQQQVDPVSWTCIEDR